MAKPEPTTMFSVNGYRQDPYRGFKFRVIWDNKMVAGVNKVSALTKSNEIDEWRTGGDPSHSRKLPGRSKYEPITLEQGVTHDTSFEVWANAVNNYSGDAAMSLANFRKDHIRIELLNLQGVTVLAYNVYRCWVSEYKALPDLDASGSGALIQSITIQNEGWERDLAVTEPTES